MHTMSKREKMDTSGEVESTQSACLSEEMSLDEEGFGLPS